jgi:hypothetical protein
VNPSALCGLIRESSRKLTVSDPGLTYLSGSALMTFRRMNAFCAAMSGSLTVATVSRKYCSAFVIVDAGRIRD